MEFTEEEKKERPAAALRGARIAGHDLGTQRSNGSPRKNRSS